MTDSEKIIYQAGWNDGVAHANKPKEPCNGTCESCDAAAVIEGLREVVKKQDEVRHCLDCGEPLIIEPRFKCGRCGHLHALRCFTYRDRGEYVAECIDLDLIAEGQTIEEAIGKLQEGMLGYIEVVFEGDKCTDGLIPRKSPLSHRLRYHYDRLLQRIHGKKHAH